MSVTVFLHCLHSYPYNTFLVYPYMPHSHHHHYLHSLARHILLSSVTYINPRHDYLYVSFLSTVVPLTTILPYTMNHFTDTPYPLLLLPSYSITSHSLRIQHIDLSPYTHHIHATPTSSLHLVCLYTMHIFKQRYKLNLLQPFYTLKHTLFGTYHLYHILLSFPLFQVCIYYTHQDYGKEKTPVKKTQRRDATQTIQQNTKTSEQPKQLNFNTMFSL